MAQHLCDLCKRLKLTVAKFTVKPSMPLERQLTAEDVDVANERIDHHTLADIRSNGHCQLCAVIAQSIPTIDQEAEIRCQLLWQLDGRQSNFPMYHGTRRLRVCWSDDRLAKYESYLVLKARVENHVGYVEGLNFETQFLGREIGGWQYKKNFIRQLLRLCEEHHDPSRCGRNLGIENSFRDTLKEPYFGVVDIENDRICRLPSEPDGAGQETFTPYATVSYVWGKERGYRTLIDNVQERCQRGGLSNVIPCLPKALKQSIQLVHSLGIRYVWIDALCIVQDSRHSWDLNARSMHLIYGNSTLTVCAADGEDGSIGLLALEEDNKTPPQHIAEYAEGVKLVLHQPPETTILHSAWNRRAWTFQERLLSRCCLIFRDKRIYFQCRSTSMSEDIFADRSGRGWSLDLVRNPLQMLSQLKRRALWFYAYYVHLYTLRDLFEPFDILAAFSGMCKLIEGTTCAPFIFGLPESHFDFALLWGPIAPATRLDKPRNKTDPKYRDVRFPTWSWCGWKNSGIRYNPDLVAGCTEDVRSWLLNHTWIDWHIRDGHGTLRRIWDKSSSDVEEDKSEDERWRGYVAQYQESSDASVSSSSSSPPRHYPPPPLPTRPPPPPPVYRPPPRRPFPPRRPSPPPPHPHSSHQVPPVTVFERKAKNTIPKTKSTARTRPPASARPQVSDSDSGSPTSADSSTPAARNEGDRLRLRQGNVFLQTFDRYGRPGWTKAVMRAHDIYPGPNFKLTLPEDPYHVRIAEATEISDDLPDQHFLQFFTWKAPFRVFRTTTQEHDLVDGMCRCHIIDSRGDKCGSIVVKEKWIEEQKTQSFQFIAISEAKSFTAHEFPDWTYYIPKEREESEWDLYFVLLLEHFPKEGIYRRVALGKVFQAAFSHWRDEWQEIILG